MGTAFTQKLQQPSFSDTSARDSPDKSVGGDVTNIPPAIVDRFRQRHVSPTRTSTTGTQVDATKPDLIPRGSTHSLFRQLIETRHTLASDDTTSRTRTSQAKDKTAPKPAHPDKFVDISPYSPPLASETEKSIRSEPPTYTSVDDLPIISKGESSIKQQPREDVRADVFRPSLPTSISTGGISSLTTGTSDIPAYTVFLPSAKPLHLPLLDAYIESLPKISFPEPEKVLNSQELAVWNEWLSQGSKENYAAPWWKRTLRRVCSWRPTRRRVYNRIDEPRKSCAPGSKEEAQRFAASTAETLKRQLMFPPMHLLPPKLTISDLKHNRSSRLPLISFNTLLSTGINGVLGAEGSSAAISLLTVEAFRDLVQTIGLALQHLSPSYGTSEPTSATEDTSKTAKSAQLMLKINRILGLDFVSSFGHAITWLWIFTLICMWACYEFMIIAGGFGFLFGRKKEDLGEGLDSEEVHAHSGPCRHAINGSTGGFYKFFGRLRRSRAYRMTIVFIITSLYVPLSKISIGALAWSSDFWALPSNPYIGTDSPNLPPLGSSAAYYETLDFCYRTNMRRESFNWAPPILIVATLTILIVTVWFPIRLFTVVQASIPTVDPYTELGEKRRSTGNAAEYERLLEIDRSPFSFMYRDYRRKWAGFKSAYMALKLVNVLAVTLITKDNCLFRSRTRAYLDIVRGGTIVGKLMFR
ncbi:hypothetical protein EMMF5_001681 [Cystobasidiomycetes sp. EMM_F5]